MSLDLNSHVIYGPILSRRLGRSLGVNVLSPFRKICSFDCIYCHYGKTGLVTVSPQSEMFYSVKEILKEVEIALRKHPYLDHVTFSGNGEPTLHPEFETLAREIKKMLLRERRDVHLALFSNSSTLERASVRKSLEWIDEPILKLDAADQATFERINQPAAGLAIEAIIRNLAEIKGATLQTLIPEGEMAEIHSDAFGNWIDAVAEIKPKAMQLYSCDEPCEDLGLKKLPLYRLHAIAEEITRKTGIPVQVY